MKIIELQSENIKRLKAVRIKPDGSLVQITGKNGAGKTSVLDSITMALAGGDVIPEKPIREGEEKAKVVVDLGDIKVTRTWTANDKTYLAVETKEGAKYPSPQALLDKLTGRLSFDPLAFARMEGKKQVETLRQLTGVDFSQVNKKREEAYSERSQVNREIKNLEIRLSSLPDTDAPDDEVDISFIMEDMDKAQRIKECNNEKRQLFSDLQKEHNNYVERAESISLSISDIEVQINKLQDQIKHLNEKKSECHHLINKTADQLKAMHVEIKILGDPNMSIYAEKMKQAHETNGAVRAKRARLALAAEITTQKDLSDALTVKIEGIDKEKEATLSQAKFPVTGLSFDESGVTYNGIPFSQASSAEQLRVSVAMGLALNPKIRVILIRDGSLLDEDNLRVIAEMAEVNDAQCWIERVATDERVGVVIEDGEVISE